MQQAILCLGRPRNIYLPGFPVLRRPAKEGRARRQGKQEIRRPQSLFGGFLAPCHFVVSSWLQILWNVKVQRCNPATERKRICFHGTAESYVVALACGGRSCSLPQGSWCSCCMIENQSGWPIRCRVHVMNDKSLVNDLSACPTVVRPIPPNVI